MSKIINTLLITVLITTSVGVYLYSKKVYVSDRSIRCDGYAKQSTTVVSIPKLKPPINCEVSFRLENLTFSEVLTNYEIKNVAYKSVSKLQGGDIKFGFIQSGSIELKPRESKTIELNVSSRWDYETLKVKTWVNKK